MQRVKETYLSSRTDEKEISGPRKLKPALEIEGIIDRVADEFKCSRDAILVKGRKRNIARDMAIYLARDLTGESGVTLGRIFGNISGAGITLRYNHLSKEIEGNNV